MLKITIAVQGMKCPMCEARACDALRKAFPKVKNVTASHKASQIVILTEEEIPEDAIRAALSPTSYTVGAIEAVTEKKKSLFGIFG